MVLSHHHALYRLVLLAGQLHAASELVCTEHTIGHQPVVLRHQHAVWRFSRVGPLADGCGQCFAQLHHTIHLKRPKGMADFAVDDLEHTFEFSPIQNGGHQHLARAVTGAAIHFFQEMQPTVNGGQLGIVVHIFDVEGLASQRNKACNALGADGQLEFLAGGQTRFDAGDNGCFVFTHCIQCQPVGIEEAANVRADIQHELRKVFCIVNTGCDLLQPPVKLCGFWRVDTRWNG